jgi:monovalent cation/proton antiporter MnhG/PhaG subunit
LTAIGLVVAHDPFDQIHYLAPSSLVGSLAVCVAVLLHEGLSQSSAKAILITILLMFSNPVLSHATARAARIRGKGQLGAMKDEQVPFVDEDE